MPSKAAPPRVLVCPECDHSEPEGGMHEHAICDWCNLGTLALELAVVESPPKPEPEYIETSPEGIRVDDL